MTGLFLMAVKYALESAVVWLATGTAWPLGVFLSPVYRTRAEQLGPAHASAVLLVLGLLSLPFLWIGLSMSLRRARDCGASGWFALCFVVPYFNYLVMLMLALLPSQRSDPDHQRRARLARSTLISTIAAVAGLGAMALITTFLLSWRLESLGTTLFFSAPVLGGAMLGYVLNRRSRLSLGATIGAAAAAVVIFFGAMLLFSIEGLICLAMAFPIALGAAMLGVLVGRGLALVEFSSLRRGVSCLALLPVSAWLERELQPEVLYEVRSSIEVGASPQQVWEQLVAIPDLPPAEEWYFKTGIAVPLRARIEGTGVGAIRYCEFTTGSFVEPITVWEPGRRLGFDVREQPPPMEEWSPFEPLHPPHLDATIRSRRGEFRLVALSEGRTRLEGSTWYSLQIAPQPYFRPWSDAIIQRIHRRVLQQVKQAAE